MAQPQRPHTLRSRVLVSIAVMLLPTAALLGSSLLAFHRLFGTVEEIVAEVTEEIQPVHQLQSLLPAPARAVRDYVLRGNPESRQTFEEASARVAGAFARARRTVPFARVEERDLLRAAEAQWRAVATAATRVLAGPPPTGVVGRAGNDYDAFEERLAHLEGFFPMMVSLARQEVEEERLRVAEELRRVRFHVAAIFVTGLVAALVAGLLLRRSILAPLRRLQSGAKHFGGGDLSHRIEPTGPDELRELARAFNVMAGQLQEEQSALMDLSLRDPLTRTFNRREFFARLGVEAEQARRRDRPLSLLMVDIDHFKAVNDAYGHPVGDAVLREVAGLLRSAVRPSDTLARYGGEEFAVLLPDTPLEGGVAIATRLAADVGSQAITAGRGERLTLTVSVGVAAFPLDAASGEELLATADGALYRAKRLGRNRVATARQAAGEERLRLVDPA